MTLTTSCEVPSRWVDWHYVVVIVCGCRPDGRQFVEVRWPACMQRETDPMSEVDLEVHFHLMHMPILSLSMRTRWLN